MAIHGVVERTRFRIVKILSAILMAAMFVFMVWIFDVRPVEALRQQHQAESYLKAQGKVMSSEVTVTHGSKSGYHYHVYISYRYVVGGHTYDGDRYRYDGHPDKEELVNDIVSEHRRGSDVDVFYNPRDPSDSVLSKGVDSEDVYFLFLTTPFCLPFLWILATVVREINPGGPRVAGGVKLISEMMVTRVRLPRIQPLVMALPALAGLSFAAAILMANGVFSGPPLVVGGWMLADVLLGGAVAYGWQYCKIHSGLQDLLIDEGARTIQLPLTYGRRTRTPEPFSQIKEVFLKKVRHQRKGGVYYTYLVTLELKDGSAHSLIDLNEARAEAFAAWLKEKLCLTGVTAILNLETSSDDKE